MHTTTAGSSDGGIGAATIAKKRRTGPAKTADLKRGWVESILAQRKEEDVHTYPPDPVSPLLTVQGAQVGENGRLVTSALADLATVDGQRWLASKDVEERLPQIARQLA